MADNATNAGAKGVTYPPELRDEVHKRMTLNWLIQGAAQHSGMTLHHFVADEISAIDSRLIPLYDKYALVNLLQYWSPTTQLIMGNPSRFWSRAQSDPQHLFYGHPCCRSTGETSQK